MTAVFRGVCRNCPNVNTHWEMRIDGTPVCFIDKNAACGPCSRKKGSRVTGHPTKHPCCPEVSSSTRSAKLAEWIEFVEKSKQEAGILKSEEDEVSVSEASVAKYCGHCHNLGVPEWVCKTHFTRECTKMICEECGEQGHLKSRCSKLQEDFEGCSHCRDIGMYESVYMSHSYDNCTFTCKHCNELHADHNPRDCPQNPKNESKSEMEPEVQAESQPEVQAESQLEEQAENQPEVQAVPTTVSQMQLEVSATSAFTSVSGSPIRARPATPSEQTLRAVFDQREKEIKEMREYILVLEEENRVFKAQDTAKELKEVHATCISSMQEEIEMLKKELRKAHLEIKASNAAYKAILESS